jgi:hypothetical protein
MLNVQPQWGVGATLQVGLPQQASGGNNTGATGGECISCLYWEKAHTARPAAVSAACAARPLFSRCESTAAATNNT